MAAYHADLLDHLHTLPSGYSAVSVQQVLRADRAAFMYLSERMTSLKRDAQNQLPFCSLEPAKRCFSPIAVVWRSSESTISAQSLESKGHEALADSNQWKAKEDQKVDQAKAVGLTSQQASSTKHWRCHRSNACVGRTICQMDAAKPKQEKAVQRAFICVQSRGASILTHFKTIVEVTIVSPKAGLSLQNRLAKFLH